MDGNKKKLVVASGHVVKLNDKFVPGIVVNVAGDEIEGIMEEEQFDTEAECTLFLKQELPVLVETLCEKLGYDIIKVAHTGVPTKTVH